MAFGVIQSGVTADLVPADLVTLKVLNYILADFVPLLNVDFI